MTKAIIQAQHPGSVNFIIALFNLVSRIVLFPFELFTSQIITQKNLFNHFNTGNKVSRGYYTILFRGF